MIPRRITNEVEALLGQFPAVGLLGPRQVGKTTLAQGLGRSRASVYLDLESARDREKLAEPLLYLERHMDKLVILDEIQRMPGIFEELRGLIDRGRASGRKAGQYLILGSASLDMIRQSGETLAGRVAYVSLDPFDISELPAEGLEGLWFRGGFPESYLAPDDALAMTWLENFIRAYLEREIPAWGTRVPAETLRRFWTMLAHQQGGSLNLSPIARSLMLDTRTVGRYLDMLVDLLLVRRIEPWLANVGKRLVKSPRILIRDSGLVHALLGLDSRESLLGHPVAGMSWEAMVLETLLRWVPPRTTAGFYRTSGGAELDLVLAIPGRGTWAIEVKRSLAPKLQRGFHSACEDIRPDRKLVVYPGREAYPLGNGVEVVPFTQLNDFFNFQKG